MSSVAGEPFATHLIENRTTTGSVEKFWGPSPMSCALPIRIQSSKSEQSEYTMLSTPWLASRGRPAILQTGITYKNCIIMQKLDPAFFGCGKARRHAFHSSKVVWTTYQEPIVTKTRVSSFCKCLAPCVCHRRGGQWVPKRLTRRG